MGGFGGDAHKPRSSHPVGVPLDGTGMGFAI
jgi:hypothetical protein